MKTFLPNYKDGSVVNLISSIKTAFGQQSLYENLKDLPSESIDSRNIILFMIDGLGYDYVEKNSKSFLFKHLKGKITSVFPSSTAPCVTSFFTGLSPSEHMITGWYMYSKEIGTTSMPLPYITRLGRIPVSLKIKSEKFFKQSTIFNNINSYILLPEDLATSDYNKTLCKKAKLVAYNGLTDFFKKINKIISKDRRKKYIYAYWPDFDILCHLYGKKSKESLKNFRKLDKEILKFSKKLKDTTIIVTADHGHIDTVKSRTIVLNKHPKVIECLERPLSGETRVAYCYVKPTFQRKFEKYIKKTFSHACDLYKSQYIAKKGWFGPNVSKELLERIGDYILIMKDNYVIKDIIIGEIDRPFIGNHGGVSEEEMFVPLIVIKK
ncbi:MAG: alkaline phosphatase family protein [Candidatus Aenigmarchaeota archaeon]|nr:alkaline phosphatase family protein [Candidatus Aenigmarchaeota archaeon]